MITTRWIRINEYLEFRYKGPKWIAFILVKAKDKKVNPMFRYGFQVICKFFNGELQYRRPLPDITSDTEIIMRMISPIYKDMD